MLAHEIPPTVTTVHLPGMPEMHPASYKFWLWQKRQEILKGLPVTWDNFETPRELAAAAVEQIVLPSGANVFDAGAGTGIWSDAAAARWPDSYRAACDFRDVPRPAGVNGSWWPERDFLLTAEPSGIGYDLIVMNPPFKLAEEFIDHAWDLLAPRGTIVALVRLALLAGQDRNRLWWPRHEARVVYVLPERPSFTGDGGTDNAEYMVVVFQKSSAGPERLDRLWWKGHAPVPAVRP